MTTDIGDGYTFSAHGGTWTITAPDGTVEADGYFDEGAPYEDLLSEAVEEWEAGRTQTRGPDPGVSFSVRWTPGVELAVSPHYAGGPYLVRKLDPDTIKRFDKVAKVLLGEIYPVMKTEEAGGSVLLYAVMEGVFI